VAGAIRSFVAVDIPENHRRTLSAYLEDCARLAPGYRWVSPESLHLTLRFLGHLEPSVLDRVRSALHDARAAPFRLELDGRRTFGSRAAPRVVWLAVAEGREACGALARAVDVACQAAGLAPEEEPFRAHVTLARQRSQGTPLPDLADPPVLAPWTVEEFVLYESKLGRGPAQYVPLVKYPL
jgi:2'-5' RNA ligase